MGFFGGGTVTTVASTVYNLAGDEANRPNYLKSTVVSGILSSDSADIADTLQKTYLNGPAIKFRNFASWSDNNGYTDLIGQVSGTIQTGDSIDSSELAAQIQANYTDDSVVNLSATSVGNADLSYWVEQWLLENNPSKIDDLWTASIGDGNVVTITYSDDTTSTFTASSYDTSVRYIYATYILTKAPVTGPLVPGTTVTLGTDESFPSTSGWTTNSYTPTTEVLNKTKTTRVVITYSDGSPGSDTTTTDSDGTYVYTESHGIYTKTDTTVGSTETTSVVSTMYQDEVGALVDTTTSTTETETTSGVTKTTVTYVTTQDGAITRTYRVDTQTSVTQTWSQTEMFIYGEGQGNTTLDAMFARSINMGEFYPFIPLRVNNVALDSEPYETTTYPLAKKAYKKATSGDVDDLLSDLASNSSIGDMDYVYASFSVALNVEDDSARKYIWTFFDALYQQSTDNVNKYTDFKTQWDAANASMEAYKAWQESGAESGAPQILPYPTLPSSTVRIYCPKNVLNYDMRITWVAFEEETGNAEGTTGTLTWGDQTTDLFYQMGIDSESGEMVTTLAKSVQKTSLTWQTSATTYKRIWCYGLVHDNNIYGGNMVTIGMFNALNDDEESGFLIPMHTAIYKAMNLVDASQMATACVFLVINCYVVKKKSFFQSGFFSIIMIVIIIVITYFTWGAGTGFATAAMATGTAIGLTGMAALIVGAALNIMAGMLIAKVLGYAATAAFGDKIGPIIGAIATVVAMAFGQAYLTNGSFSLTTTFSNLTAPSSLLQLTTATINGVGQGMSNVAQDYANQTAQIQSDYTSMQDTITEAYKEYVGYASQELSGMMYVNQPIQVESSDQFLTRTLMTGSDIADLNAYTISGFCDSTLDISQNINV